MLDCYGPAQPVSLFLSIGTGVPEDAVATGSLMNTATTVASIATNSEISNILFRSLLNAFSPVSMAKKYWRLNVGNGLPDWIVTKVKDEKTGEEVYQGKWVLLGKRVEENIGDLDDVSAIGQTRAKAHAYIESPAGQKLIGEIVESMNAASREVGT